MTTKYTEIAGRGIPADPTTGWTSPVIIKGFIDLGLAIGEACKILSAYMQIKLGTEMITVGFCQCIFGLSFDPQEVSGPSIADNEVFALLDNSIHQEATGAGGSMQRVVQRYYDFTTLNLITTRNIGLIATAESERIAVTPEVLIMAKVYYERYTPTANDLNMLIATRR
ncbi:hypothetical protein ES703_121322 [subsurface metagenome]